MAEFPFAFQCTIPQNQLIPLKDSINGYLNSSYISNIPGIEYYFSIYPNGFDDKTRGKIMILLRLKFENSKKIITNFTITIKSANVSEKCNCIYEKSWGYGTFIAKTKEFFDSEKKFIVNENFTVKINGTFKFEHDEMAFGTPDDGIQKWEGGEFSNELWETNYNKDFTIIVWGGEINVHQSVLGTQSEVFKAMFNPKTKESIRSEVYTYDFSFNVLETAVKLIYLCNFDSALTVDELMSLLQFLDKYKLPAIKEKVERFLIDEISASTVCKLTNHSILTNSMKLKTECMKFLMDSFASKTALKNIEILDKDVAMEMLQESLYQTVTIQ